jgi:pimeloyl-ACP methyl ester carboxylesterase
MVDARGHGESDKPHAVADYALDKRVGDLLAVLDHAGVGRAHYWGYSMGGWIGFGLAARAPERLASLVLGGAHPYADPAEAFLGVDGSDPEVFIAAMERFARIRATPEVRERLLQNDLRALAAAMHPRASQEAELPRMRTPALLYVGDQDPRLEAVRQCAAAMPQAQFLALPGLDHSSAFQRSASVVPQVLAFLASANNREP